MRILSQTVLVSSGFDDFPKFEVLLSNSPKFEIRNKNVLAVAVPCFDATKANT